MTLAGTLCLHLKKKKRGPWATSLTWVILADTSHKNTCKITFLYCGPNCTGTTLLCIKSPFNQICTFVVQEFLQKIFPLKQMAICFTLLCGPPRPPGTMIWRNLNLHYIKKLSCKYELFWLCGFWEVNFSMTPPHFSIFVIISPLKRTWPLIWKLKSSMTNG